MTEEERRALGERRRLIFGNIARGVPVERVMADMKLSRQDVEQAVKFVTRKILEYRVLRRQPPIPCATPGEIVFNRRALLGVLAYIGNLDLSTDLIIPKILVQAIDHPEMVEGVTRRMQEAHQ